VTQLTIVQSELRATYSDDRHPVPVPWLLSQKHQLEFFAIPGDFCLNKSSSFRSGRVYGMDVTSGAAVAAMLLDIYDQNDDDSGKEHEHILTKQEPLRVLDLCCAPG
jgi:hypothetical protein